MAERILSHAENAADGAVHVAGIAASIVAVSFLLAVYTPQGTTGMSLALAIYGITVILLFCVSAANNLITHEGWQPLLQRFDHAAIYLKIAGTYTPLVIMMGSMFANAVLALIWAGAAAGAGARLAFGDRFARQSVWLYLLLGWAGTAVIWVMVETLPPGAVILVLAGGLLYTIGVLFHVRQNLKFQRAIWHCFVLAASSCHFIAVAWASLGSLA
jgi:hemolysin III